MKERAYLFLSVSLGWLSQRHCLNISYGDKKKRKKKERVNKLRLRKLFALVTTQITVFCLLLCPAVLDRKVLLQKEKETGSYTIGQMGSEQLVPPL